MRTHLASVTLVGAALFAAGCGGGHPATRGFGALPSPAPASPAPPVVVAEPAPSNAPAATPSPAPAAAAAPADSAKALAKTQKANKRLRHQRVLTQRKLHREHAAAVKARKLAAAREKALQNELAAARTTAAPHRARTHHAKPHAPIRASDINATDDAQRGARVAIVRFHDLLNAHDGMACALLSVRFLEDHFPGDDTAAQRANCQSGVEGLSSPVSVLIESSGDEPGGVWVRMTSRFGDAQHHQIMHLVPFGSAWMIDSVESA